MRSLILIIVVLVVIAAGGWVYWKKKIEPKTDTSEVSVAGKFQEAKTDSQNWVEVVVKVKPQVCDDFCENEAAFEVSFTTHEGDLSFDLVKASTLEIEGVVLPAKSWDGGSGGHHLSGTLTFPGLEKEPTKMVLKMANIAGADRTFTWE